MQSNEHLTSSIQTQEIFWEPSTLYLDEAHSVFGDHWIYFLLLLPTT